MKALPFVLGFIAHSLSMVALSMRVLFGALLGLISVSMMRYPLAAFFAFVVLPPIVFGLPSAIIGAHALFAAWTALFIIWVFCVAFWWVRGSK